MPTSRLTCDEKIIPLDAQAGQKKLCTGTPRLAYSATDFLTRNLKDGEEEMVAKAVNLRGPARQRLDSKC
jgi:hypothetical protein